MATLKDIDRLDTLGFDESMLLPRQNGKRAAWVKCSQCEAMVINDIPAHETGCPNATHECDGCNEIVPARQKYCEDCR